MISSAGKRRRAPVSIKLLEDQKSFIVEQFIGHEKTDKQVRHLLAERGIDISHAQLERLLRSWGVRKKLSREEWKAVLTRYDDTQSAYPEASIYLYISGHIVGQDRIDRARERYMSGSSGTAAECPAAVAIGTHAEDGTWIDLIKPGTKDRRQFPSDAGVLTYEVPRAESATEIPPANALLPVVGRHIISCRPQPTGFDILRVLKRRNLLDGDNHDSDDAVICFDPSMIEVMLQETSFAKFLPYAVFGLQSVSQQLQRGRGTRSAILQVFEPSPEMNQSIMAQQRFDRFRSFLPESLLSHGSFLPSEAFPQTFLRLVIYSLANGFAGMTLEAKERLMSSLCQMPGFGPFLAQSFAQNPSAYTKAMAETLFQAAVECNDCNTVAILLHHSVVDVNRVSCHEYMGALARAAYLGQVRMVDILLQKNADPDGTAQKGHGLRHNHKPLFVAFRSRDSTASTRAAVAELLLNANAGVPDILVPEMLRDSDTRPLGELIIRNGLVRYSYGRIQTDIGKSLIEYCDMGQHSLLIEAFFSVAELHAEASEALDDYQDSVLQALISAVEEGSIDALKLILVHIRSKRVKFLPWLSRFNRPFEAPKRNQHEVYKVFIQEIPELLLSSFFWTSDGILSGSSTSKHQWSTSLYAFSIFSGDSDLAQMLEKAGAITHDDYQYFGLAWIAAIHAQDVDRLHMFKAQGYIDKYLKKLRNSGYRSAYLRELDDSAATTALRCAAEAGDEDLAWQVLSFMVQVNDGLGLSISDGLKCLAFDGIWQWPEIFQSLCAMIEDIRPEYLWENIRGGLLPLDLQRVCFQAIRCSQPELVELLVPALQALPTRIPIFDPGELLNFLGVSITEMLEQLDQLTACGLLNEATLNTLFACCVERQDDLRSFAILNRVKTIFGRTLNALVRARRHDLLEASLKKCTLQDGRALANFGTSSLIVAIEQQPVDMHAVEMLLNCPGIDNFGHRSLETEAAEFICTLHSNMARTPYTREEDYRLALSKCYDVNLEYLDNGWNETAMMAVISAVRNGRLDCLHLAQRLLRDAPDPVQFMHRRFCLEPSVSNRNGDNQTGSSSHFLEAIGSGQVPLVRLFLTHNADVNYFPGGAHRETPLQEAAIAGHLGVVELLLEHGADVNALPAVLRGSTALQAAAGSGSLSIVQKLLEHGADVYAPPAAIEGRGPLEEAAANSRFDMIDFLWCASRTCRRRFDQAQIIRAIQAARERGYNGCADRLEELASSWPEGELPPEWQMPVIDPLISGGNDFAELFPNGQIPSAFASPANSSFT